MSTPEKKKRKMHELPPTQQPKPNSSLHDELLVSCFARVSRLYYPTLSLVSKSFRSLLTSPELYKARSLLGNTESCLYVCLESITTGCRWFTLCRKPDQTLTNGTVRSKKKKKKSSGYVLAKVSTLHSPHGVFSGLVAVGSNIYNIGSSSSFSILDCQTHTWHKGPSLRVKQLTLSASVVDRKIYVVGTHGYALKSSSEVFDTKTQSTWEHVPPIPCGQTPRGFKFRSACLDGKFHVMTHEGVLCYNSKQGRWAEARMDSLWRSDSYCVIGNVLYTVLDGAFRWYDTEEDMWRNLKGLVGKLPKFIPSVYVRLADHGGKMAVMWYLNGFSSAENIIWCAEIALKRPRSCEILGEVEWCDHVLTVPMGCNIEKALAVTV